MTAPEHLDFPALAQRGEPPYDRLLLALAAEFHDVDRVEALEELDELARPLFGVAERDPRAAGELIAAELGGHAGLRPAESGPDDLFLDRVLSRRRGHPALLSAVYIEVGRRAGVPLSLLSAQDAWFAGIVCDEEAVLVDPARVAGTLQGHFVLHRHCSHELAHVALCELMHRFRTAGSANSARRAGELRLALPLGEELLTRARAELRQLDREGC